MRAFRDLGLPVLGLMLLAACSGAANGPLGGGNPNGNFAQGTLGSQPDIQNMSRTCAAPYVLRFSGEKAGELSHWYIPQGDQKYFPTPGLIVKASTDAIPDDQICSQCGGRILRVVDFGEVPLSALTASQYESEFSKFFLGVIQHQVDPAIIAQSRYQDFVVNPVGDVAIKELPVALNHYYQFLLSNQELPPVSEPTPFKSPDEFYAMQGCSHDAESYPFTSVRVLRAMDHEPATVLNLHPFSTPVPTLDPSVIQVQPGSLGTIQPVVHPIVHGSDTSEDEEP